MAVRLTVTDGQEVGAGRQEPFWGAWDGGDTQYPPPLPVSPPFSLPPFRPGFAFEGLASSPDPSWGFVYSCNCIISWSL